MSEPLRPMLFDILMRHDGMGGRVHHLYLGQWNRQQLRGVWEEFLGEFTITTGATPCDADWVGPITDRLLRVTLPDGRVVDCRSMCFTIDPGYVPPPQAAKPKRGKREKKAAEPPRPVQEALAL